MITGKTEFYNISAILCARMVSRNAASRQQARVDAVLLLADLSKSLRNSPHCRSEIAALTTLIEGIKNV